MGFTFMQGISLSGLGREPLLMMPVLGRVAGASAVV
jgi:hypothetical protein